MDFNAKYDIHYNIVRYAEILQFNFFYKESFGKPYTKNDENNNLHLTFQFT